MASIFGHIGVETPAYTVLKKAAAYEIRQYGKQVRAEVETELPSGPMMRNLGQPFRMLAGYIFGGNTARSASQEAAGKSEKVAMTAPVVMQQQQQQQQPEGTAQAAAQGGKSEKVAMTAPVLMQQQGQPQPTSASKIKMSFIMPSKYSSPDNLPVPKDARVSLVEVPEHKMAVVRFSGTFSDQHFRQKEAALRAAAAADGVKLSDDPTAVQFAGYNPPWTLPWFRTNEVMVPVLEFTEEK